MHCPNTGSITLDKYLKILEAKYDVAFTYADKNIKNVYVTEPKEDVLSLGKHIEILEELTDLEFNILSSKYIAIRKANQTIEITGTIIDKETKLIIDGAIIYSKKNYAISDSSGKFSFVANLGKDSLLTIQHTGYKTLLRPINKDSRGVVFELVPDVKELEEVVINYIAKGIDKLMDGSVQLNVKNIETLPGLIDADVLHTIQLFPGVKSINETVSDINIRGGTNDQNLVLWDGVKMYQTGHFFGLISAFNSHLINKTTIINNGTSAKYGEGVSGIIDMRQNDHLVNKPEINAGINLISADAIVKLPISNKLSLFMGARRSIHDIINTPTYNNYYDRAFNHSEASRHHLNDLIPDKHHAFLFYDLSASLIYDISENDKIKVSFLNIHNNIEFEEYNLIQDTLKNKISNLSQRSYVANVKYSRSWHDKHTTSVSGHLSKYNLDGFNADVVNDQHHSQKNEVLDWGIKLNSRLSLNKDFNIVNGYNFNEIGVRNFDNIFKPNYTRDVKDVIRVHALYTETEFKNLFERIYFRFGLRANYFNKFDKLLLEPRMAFNIKLIDNISLMLLAESKSQFTTQTIDYQTDFLGIEKRRWVLSNNKSVPVIKSLQYSLGINYNKKNLLVSLEAYNKSVNGIISPSQGFQNQFEYIYALGEYNTKGLETLINKRFAKWNSWINYSFSKNDYTFPDFIPSVFPHNLDIQHALSLGCSYSWKNFDISSGLNWRTGKPYTQPQQESTGSKNEIIYEDPNSSRIGDFIRFDISTKYKFHIDKINGELGASVWNVLNRKNTINIYYQVNGEGEINMVSQYALKITPNVSLRLRF